MISALKNLFLFIMLATMLPAACKQKQSKSIVNEQQADSNAVIKAGPGLNIQQAGNGDTTLLLIHSFGGNIEQWQPQIQYWSDRFRVIAFDLPAHGNSHAAKDDNYSIAALEKYLELLADSMNLNKFILIGHSMGASTALAYAAKHPEKIMALVLEGAAGQMPAAQKTQIMALLNSEKYDTVMDEYMNKLLANATITTNRSEREGMRKLSRQEILKMIQSNFDFDNVAAFKQYKGPVLIVSADNEDSLPGALGSFFPGASKVHIDKTSHWVHMDKPAAFNKAVDSFLLHAKSAASATY